MYVLKDSKNKERSYLFISFSVSSSTNSINSKYDPELLKADLALSKERVRRLKQELAQITSEISFTQRGVKTLYEYVLFVILLQLVRKTELSNLSRK